MSFRIEPDPGIDSRLVELVVGPKGIPGIVQERAGFFLFFGQQVYPMLLTHIADLAEMYCLDDGRPPENPVRLMAVMLLQFSERLPDRQAAEACQFDVRWKVALHMRPDEAVFHPSLLTYFRARVLKCQKSRLVFEATLELLQAGGWLKGHAKQRLDSTHVHGLLREMGRLECIRETLRLALFALKDASVPVDDSLRQIWMAYVEQKYDFHSSPEKMKRDAAQAGRDLRDLLAWTAQLPETIRKLEPLQLLARVYAENYETNPSDEPQLTRCQPPGGVQNPHEPEAEWCTKSTTKDKEWVGYKVQVAETVQDEPRQPGEPTKNFITSIVTQSATESDKAGMRQTFEEQREQGLEAPPTLYVDGAYVSGAALHQAAEDGRELMGPATASPDRGKVYPCEKFQVDIEQRRALCPAGKESTQCSRLEEGKTGKVNFRFEWSTACRHCAQRNHCISAGQKHRTLVVGEHHTLLQQRRHDMETTEFAKEMQRRNGIEGTISELARGHGLRNARYRGRDKVRLQNYFTGAACNIRRLFRRLRWEQRQSADGLSPAVIPARA